MTDPSRPLVLVLDDDEDTTLLMELVLGRYPLRIEVVHSCAQARRRIEQGGIDALLFDLNVADGNGYDLVAALPSRPRVLMVLSGASSDEERRRGRELGCSDYFVKPADLDEVARRLVERLKQTP